MPLSIGEVIQGRYRIDALLGRGGMGAVYRATDLRFDSPVAIKDNYMVTPESQRRFAREAQLLHKLRHPNLPRVADHFFISGRGQYLVMKYIQGEDLDQILDRRGPQAESHVLSWLSQVLAALEYLHRRRIIHRDVKPAKIRTTRGPFTARDMFTRGAFSLAKNESQGNHSAGADHHWDPDTSMWVNGTD